MVLFVIKENKYIFKSLKTCIQIVKQNVELLLALVIKQLIS
jgi:hypothetical protein